MATVDSTRTRVSAKDFPRWLHTPSGYWRRKVRGKRHYFSKNRGQALRIWLDQKDDLLAGCEPRKLDENAVAVRLLVNAFLTRAGQVGLRRPVAPPFRRLEGRLRFLAEVRRQGEIGQRPGAG